MDRNDPTVSNSRTIICREKNQLKHIMCRRNLGKRDVRLPGKGNSKSHGARPVHLIITKMKWIRTSRLSIKSSLYVFCQSRPLYIFLVNNSLYRTLNVAITEIPLYIFIEKEGARGRWTARCCREAPWPTPPRCPAPAYEALGQLLQRHPEAGSSWPSWPREVHCD